MDWADAHLIVNHFPIVLGIVGAASAILGAVLRRGFYWKFAMTCLLVAGITAYPAVLSGTQAKRVVERSWYAARAPIREHEEAGELAMWILIATGIVSGYGLYSSSRPAAPGRRAFPGWLQVLILIGAVASAGAVGWAAINGTAIVHESPLLLGQPR